MLMALVRWRDHAEAISQPVAYAREQPVIVHAGPSAHAHGNTRSAPIYRIPADYLITEAGFGADICQRFFNIKCRTSGLVPDAAVLVATVRALKAHSGKYRIVAGKDLPEDLLRENPDDVEAGAANLRKQIQNVKAHGVIPVVAINGLPTDHDSEHAAIRRVAGDGGHALRCARISRGGGGATASRSVVEEWESAQFSIPVSRRASLKDKIEAVATRI